MWRNPVSVEQAFESVCSALPLGPAGGLHVRRVAHFVRSIDAARIRTEPYLVQLTPHLGRLVRDMDASGLDPADLETVLEALEHIGPAALPSGEREDFEETQERLRRMLILQYAYAGDLRRVRRHAQAPASASPDTAPSSTAGDSMLARLETLADRLEAEAPAAAERLRWVVCEWRSHLSGGGAVVPVMASFTGESGLTRAALLRFHLKAATADRTTSDLQLEQRCDGRLQKDLCSVPVRAVEALKGLYPISRIPARHARLHWERAHFVLSGRSALLAVAVLYYCESLLHEGSRFRYSIRPDAAFTAAMNAHGNVLKIEASTLEPRVRGAFFSWVNVLAVPDAQAESARRMVRRLRRVFPHRDLEIAGVARLSDTLEHPRLVQVRKSSLGAQLAGLVRLW